MNYASLSTVAGSEKPYQPKTNTMYDSNNTFRKTADDYNKSGGRKTRKRKKRKRKASLAQW